MDEQAELEANLMNQIDGTAIDDVMYRATNMVSDMISRADTVIMHRSTVVQQEKAILKLSMIVLAMKGKFGEY